MAYTLDQSIDRIRRLANDKVGNGEQFFTDRDIIVELRAALLETLGKNPEAFYTIIGTADQLSSFGDKFPSGQGSAPTMPVDPACIPDIELRAFKTLNMRTVRRREAA